MRKKRMEAFETIQPLFRAAEATVDQAAAEAASLIAEMLKARTRAGLSIDTGSEMLDKLMQALAANIEARKRFIEAHALTPALLKEMRLERMFGDESPCPKTAGLEGSGHVVPIGAAA